MRNEVTVVSTCKIEIITLSDNYIQLVIGDFYGILSQCEALYALNFFILKKEIHPWLRTKAAHEEHCKSLSFPYEEKDYRCQK